MPLTPPLYYVELASARNAGAFAFSGTNFDQMAWALSTALVQWGPSIRLQGIATGNAGAGTINVPTTRLFLVPNVPLMVAGLSSAGMVGPLSSALAVVVASAIAKAVSSYGGYTGTVVGVGNGFDASRVIVANAGSLFPTLLAQMQGFLGVGPAAPMLAKGLSQGIASMLLTATGTGTVVGTPSPIGATGSSTSVMV
jgi:hypothetical protein